MIAQALQVIVTAVDIADGELKRFLVSVAASEEYASVPDVIRLRQSLARFRKDVIEVFDDLRD